jgi:hypothetical protein
MGNLQAVGTKALNHFFQMCLPICPEKRVLPDRGVLETPPVPQGDLLGIALSPKLASFSFQEHF